MLDASKERKIKGIFLEIRCLVVHTKVDEKLAIHILDIMCRFFVSFKEDPWTSRLDRIKASLTLS
jgi:hypothetical protein